METKLTDTKKTGTHKRRFAKVTLYLEVPSTHVDKFGNVLFMSDNDIANMVEKCVIDSNYDIKSTSYPDIVTSDIESDDPKEFNSPVGYLAPDGNFYLIESYENGLAHLHLEHRVYQLYEELIDNVTECNLGLRLEYAGFIKVHGSDIRYYSGVPLEWTKDGTKYSPKVNDIQRKKLIEYAEYIRRDQCIKSIEINDLHVTITKLKTADEIQFDRLFHI